MSLAGQVAIVTGASRGIGAAVARKLAAEGAAVAVNYHASAAEAEAVAEGVRDSGGRALAIGADIGDPAQVTAMLETVEQRLGSPEILVNNAGVMYTAELEDFDPARMEAMRRTNVDGFIHVTRLVAAGMRRRNYGRIVNLTSIAAFGTALPGTTFYAATKAAIIVLTRRFALDLGRYGITVNAVAPGLIETDMLTHGRSSEQVAAVVQEMARRAMVGRTGRPEDVAHAVAFLVSREAAFITAQVLTVDGGRMDYIAHP